MRPRSVAVFEALYLLTILISFVQAALGWRQATAIASPALVVTVQVITIVILLTLVLLISRRRQNWARWVLVVLFVIGLPALARIVMSGQLPGSLWITIVQTVLQLVALAMLFTPPAQEWFRKRLLPGAI